MEVQSSGLSGASYALTTEILVFKLCCNPGEDTKKLGEDGHECPERDEEETISGFC